MSKLFQFLRKLIALAGKETVSNITAANYDVISALAKIGLKDSEVNRLTANLLDEAYANMLAKLTYLAKNPKVAADVSKTALETLRLLANDDAALTAFTRLAYIARATAANSAEALDIVMRPTATVLKAANEGKAMPIVRVVAGKQNLATAAEQYATQVEALSKRNPAAADSLLSKAFARAASALEQAFSATKINLAKLTKKWETLSVRKKIHAIALISAILGGGTALFAYFMRGESNKAETEKYAGKVVETNEDEEMAIYDEAETEDNLFEEEEEGVDVQAQMLAESARETSDRRGRAIPCVYSPIITIDYDKDWKHFFGIQ